MNKRLVYGELCGGVQRYDNASEGGEADNKAKLNIFVGRNRKSGNLEIGVPVLGNRLFCA